MVLALFVVSFALALTISYGLSKICREAAETVLSRFLARNISTAAAKYLQFVIILVGASNGTRIRLLEDYLGAPDWNRPELTAQLTQELWALALYHTFIDSLAGVIWLLVAFSFMVLVALYIIRRSDLKWLLCEREQTRQGQAKEPVVPIR